jgi:poly-gamma-glutamate synthesis protein (capsule biosynthesis protein)
MTARVGFVGDTMLGRGVGERLAAERRPTPAMVVSDAVSELVAETDLLVANLECCLSSRGQRWPDPGKAFFFRGPPAAAELLARLGVGAATLANNHALDYGHTGLADTLAALEKAGVAHVGAGPDLAAARTSTVLRAGSLRVGLVGLTDHPPAFGATADRAGVAFADLRTGVPDWLSEALGELEADITVATPHWGPNMVAEPVDHVRAAGPALIEAGADVVAGHSAHVFHGVETRAGAAVCYDLGDFIDDYAVDPGLRNDLGVFWVFELERDGPVGVQAVPLKLDFCHTRLAEGKDAAWVRRRLRAACEPFATAVRDDGERVTIEMP